MKPNQIFQVLNLAKRARSKGFKFNPLFVGPAGLGKSEIIQQWCKAQDMPFIDLRAAYLEAPDLIGFPSIENMNGSQRTVHNIPEFWPDDGEGVIFLDEVNRGTTSVMNTFMQLLTDRKVHKKPIPAGWLIVGAVNPPDAEHDVNTMDTAMSDRFEIYTVTYDKQTFVDFMNENNWDESIRMFVESGTWAYTAPGDIGNAAGSKYISPRTLSKLEAALKSGLPDDIELITYESILGTTVGSKFYHFKHNEQPVLYTDIVQNKRKALANLKKFGDPKNYKAGHFSITIRNIVETNLITDDVLIDVLEALPADQGAALLKELEYKRKDYNLYERILGLAPELRNYFKKLTQK